MLRTNKNIMLKLVARQTWKVLPFRPSSGAIAKSRCIYFHVSVERINKQSVQRFHYIHLGVSKAFATACFIINDVATQLPANATAAQYPNNAGCTGLTPDRVALKNKKWSNGNWKLDSTNRLAGTHCSLSENNETSSAGKLWNSTTKPGQRRLSIPSSQQKEMAISGTLVH